MVIDCNRIVETVEKRFHVPFLKIRILRKLLRCSTESVLYFNRSQMNELIRIEAVDTIPSFLQSAA